MDAYRAHQQGYGHPLTIIHVQKVEEKITAAKEEMKKLLFKEKVMRMVEIKQLQQEFQDLCDQANTREVQVEAHHSEAVLEYIKPTHNLG